ncbi:GAF and ANTAR domain-containing protein [Georgenia sp. SYP-B2076]|uniref:GAF and ANTAR domain-containing protein n=1 Tax=Georgenia sp. SYP-B2076 TaxID=2495881 RepID=UPI000F8CFD4D|nr:GAF and ANTAR domain-containing protein [Georgenia sp. SYP-B2076]
MLGALASRVTGVLGLAGSGVTLATDGALRLVTAVPDDIAELERCQEEFQRGPCVTAYLSGRVVAVPDLRAEPGRWLELGAAAEAHGVGAVAGIPMRLNEDTFGALNLYAAGPREWPEEDLAAAVVLADIATSYLINASKYHQQQALNEQLQQALEARIVIAQARSIDVEQAFQRIREHARSHNARVREVAEAIVHVGLRV